jgi:hypothetical protein
MLQGGRNGCFVDSEKQVTTSKSNQGIKRHHRESLKEREDLGRWR